MRVRPVDRVIDAWQLGSDELCPRWVYDADKEGVLQSDSVFIEKSDYIMFGTRKITPGDWILNDNGIIMCCSNRTFQERYVKI